MPLSLLNRGGAFNELTVANAAMGFLDPRALLPKSGDSEHTEYIIGLCDTDRKSLDGKPSTRVTDARDYLLADGATGTNYFELGLGAGDSPELWNADHADRVKALHRAFIEAGSDIVLTNTFGGNRYRLKLHDAENRVFELNELAAKNARAEADQREARCGCGFDGANGEIFAPVGSLDMVDGKLHFASRPKAWPQVAPIYSGSRRCLRAKR